MYFYLTEINILAAVGRMSLSFKGLLNAGQIKKMITEVGTGR